MGRNLGDGGVTPRDLALMATADHDCLGDESSAVEPEPTHAELHARLRLSIELVKQARRMTEMEGQIEDQRQTINAIVTRFATDGRPLPTSLVNGAPRLHHD